MGVLQQGTRGRTGRRCGRGRRPPRGAGRTGPHRCPAAPASSTARRARARWAAASSKASRARSARAARSGPAHGALATVERDSRRAVPGQVGRHTVAPRAWRCSSASAMRWCSASRRGTGSAAAMVSRNRSCANRTRAPSSSVPSRTSTPARTPSSMSRATAGGSRPHTSARTSGNSWLPATAAASTNARQSGESRSTRRATRSRAAAGTAPAGRVGFTEQLGELAGEEGVAVGATVHLGGPPGGGRLADRVGDQLGHLLAATARAAARVRRARPTPPPSRPRRRARRAGRRRRPPAAPAGRAGRRTAAAPPSTRRPSAGRRARRRRAHAWRVAPGSGRRHRTAVAVLRRCPSPAPPAVSSSAGASSGSRRASSAVSVRVMRWATSGPTDVNRLRRAAVHAQNAGARSAQVPQPTSSPLRAAASPISVVLPMPA